MTKACSGLAAVQNSQVILAIRLGMSGSELGGGVGHAAIFGNGSAVGTGCD